MVRRVTAGPPHHNRIAAYEKDFAMSDPTVSADQQRATEMAAGLRALADAVETNPALAEGLRYTIREGSLSVYPDDRDKLVGLVRMLKAAGATISKEFVGDYFRSFGNFGPVRVRLVAQRTEVCEKVVVGVETVTKQVPDPELLAEVPLVEVTEEVETVEWICHPLMDDKSTRDSTEALAGTVAAS